VLNVQSFKPSNEKTSDLQDYLLPSIVPNVQTFKPSNFQTIRIRELPPPQKREALEESRAVSLEKKLLLIEKEFSGIRSKVMVLIIYSKKQTL